MTTLTDIFEPRLFNAYVTEAITAKSALFNSGAIVQSPQIAEMAASAGRTGDLPFFTEDQYAAPTVAKDTNDNISATAVGTGVQTFQKDFLNKSWGTANLTAQVAGEDVIGHVAANVVAPYWTQAYQDLAIKKLNGVLKDNIANDDGDMVVDVAVTEAGAGVALDLDVVIDGRATLGDRMNDQMIMIVHSKVYAGLMKREAHNFTKPSEVEPFERYNGMIILVDDAVPATAGANQTVYTSFLLGAGALAIGDAALPDANVIDVDQKAGNGSGTSTLISRRRLILHPAGFASSATVAAGFASPSFNAYDAASAWDRVVSRKNAKIVGIKTNG